MQHLVESSEEKVCSYTRYI